MRKLLLQLDSSRLPSVFDQIVAYDAGADVVMSYGGVTESDVRDLDSWLHLHPRPQGSAQHRCLDRRQQHVRGRAAPRHGSRRPLAPLSVSIMLDSNGSNTTAVAAVVKIEETVGDLRGKKVIILAGTGPVGQRAAGLLAHDGARVTITSRKPEQGEKARQFISARFNVQVEAVTLADPSKLPEILEGAEILLNSGPAGVQMVPEVSLDRREDAPGSRGPERRAPPRDRGHRRQR